MNITHTRTEITIVRDVPVCPICKKRPMFNKTCGVPECQYWHHIAVMRSKRKTDKVIMSRRVDAPKKEPGSSVVAEQPGVGS